MPHLRFRAVTEKQVQHLSESLVTKLAAVLNTTDDNFTFEHIPSRFFSGGKEVGSYPFVEVLWFARTKEQQQSVANMVTDAVKAITQAVDVVVVFLLLEESGYYENGKHF